jgi:hypothetical protein
MKYVIRWKDPWIGDYVFLTRCEHGWSQNIRKAAKYAERPDEILADEEFVSIQKARKDKRVFDVTQKLIAGK